MASGKCCKKFVLATRVSYSTILQSGFDNQQLSSRYKYICDGTSAAQLTATGGGTITNLWMVQTSQVFPVYAYICLFFLFPVLILHKIKKQPTIFQKWLSVNTTFEFYFLWSTVFRLEDSSSSCLSAAWNLLWLVKKHIWFGRMVHWISPLKASCIKGFEWQKTLAPMAERTVDTNLCSEAKQEPGPGERPWHVKCVQGRVFCLCFVQVVQSKYLEKDMMMLDTRWLRTPHPPILQETVFYSYLLVIMM